MTTPCPHCGAGSPPATRVADPVTEEPCVCSCCHVAPARVGDLCLWCLGAGDWSDAGGVVKLDGNRIRLERWDERGGVR